MVSRKKKDQPSNSGQRCLPLLIRRVAFLSIFVAFFWANWNGYLYRYQRSNLKPTIAKRSSAKNNHTQKSLGNKSAFVDKHCDLTTGGSSLLTNETYWMPPEGHFLRRVPHFMIPGQKKSGTTSLHGYLTQHPQIVTARKKEVYFFTHLLKFHETYNSSEGKIIVNKARIDMLKDGVNYNTNLLRHNKSLISVDATPDYLFFPHSPEWILCVCPWIKLVIILRDPISRCYSNYMYNFRLVKEEKKKPTFEKFLSTDLSQLRASGFFNATSADGRFHSYRKYLANRQGEGPVARSLYEFQLRQWIDAFRSIEREPTDAMHIVTTEQMEADPEKVLNGVYKFLGLPPAQHKFTHAVKSKYTDPIQPKTRDKLEDIFLPANQRLYRYLINEGFGDGWKNYWEKKGTQEKKE